MSPPDDGQTPAPPAAPPPKPTPRQLALKVAGTVALTLAIMLPAFYVYGVTQFVFQALAAFDSPTAVSATFLVKVASDFGDATQQVKASSDGVSALAGRAEKASDDLGQAQRALYQQKSDFKQFALPILIATKGVSPADIKTGLDYGDVESNYLLLVRNCSGGQTVCQDARGRVYQAQWDGVRAAQQLVTSKQVEFDDLQRKLSAATAGLHARQGELEAQEANKNDSRRAILELWKRYGHVCDAAPRMICVDANTPLSSLMILLAMLMGALGSLTLSWVGLVETGSVSDPVTLFLNPVIGAVVGLLGYFVLLFGAAFFAAGGIAAGASATDPKTVVALSLLLGLGGGSTLDAFKTLGGYIRDKLASLK